MPDEEKCNDSSDNFFISYVDYNILNTSPSTYITSVMPLSIPNRLG